MNLNIANTQSPKEALLNQTRKVMTLKVNYWWLIAISVLLRLFPFIFSATSLLVGFQRVCIILSYTLLFFAFWRNTHIGGVWIIAFGTLLNFVAIIANGCFMPVSPNARYLAGMPPVKIPSEGIILTRTGGVILPVEQTELWFLTDIIPVSYVHTVFSIGDVIIGVGIVIACVNLFSRVINRIQTPILDSSVRKK